MVAQAERFDVWLVELNSTQGSEINKRRPCVVISPNELSRLATVIVVPMTTKGFKVASRIDIDFQGKSGLIVLDQLRTIDKSRLIKKLGIIDKSIQLKICNILREMFAY
ncbi:MAG: type II toxin-antitoxin system PemK/MazF family toxin [Proteobacteria bacterium]|nr:type II toxin-antitoxin system PemK/MazF family toxin [Pseudomonadota bacterium]